MPWNRLIFIVCFMIVVLIKFMPIPIWNDMVNEDQENDLHHYTAIAKDFINGSTNENKRVYQYPPIYPILIIPGILLDNLYVYILIMDAIFASMIFIALIFFTRRYLNEPFATLLSAIVVIVDFFISPIKSFGYPFMFGTLLFVILVYYLTDRKTWLHASIVYACLVGLMYVSLFLAPFILLWIYIKRKDLVDSIRSAFIFAIPASLVFLGWSLHNMSLHGTSVAGAIGGYASLNFFNGFIVRLQSMIVYAEPNFILIYTIGFFFGFMLTVKRRQKRLYPIYVAFSFNLLFFIFVPGMAWQLNYLAWRYICFLMPCYIVLTFYPLFDQLSTKIKKSR